MTCIIALLLPTFAHASLTGVDDNNPTLPATVRETIDNAVMTYYQQPSVEKVNAVLDTMTNSDILRKKPAWPPLVGFLTVVFAAHPEHVYQWISRNDYDTYSQDVIMAALLHAKLKEDAITFAKGEQWKEGDIAELEARQDTVDLKKLPILLPGHIDTLWGAFFGSGDPVYVNEIINVLFLKALPEAAKAITPEGYDMLAENKKLAQSTLSQYASTHKAVRNIIERRIAKEQTDANRLMLKKLLPAR